MPSKIWQTLGDALSVMELYMSLFQLVLLYPSSNMNYICPFSNLNYIAVALFSNLNYIVVALFCAIFSKLKSSLFKHLFPTIQKIIYAFALIQQWLMLQMQWNLRGLLVVTRVSFWLMYMGLWWVIHPVMPFTVDDRGFSGWEWYYLIPTVRSTLRSVHGLHKSYRVVGCIYAQYAVSEGGHLLYTCEQFYDFNIDAAKSIFAQAHEMQLLVG